MAIIKYDGGGRPGGKVTESISHDGGKTWNSPSGGQNNSLATGSRGNAGNTGSTVNSSGTQWNNYAGSTGKQYSVAGSNGTIQVTRPDGTTSTVRPTDANYQATLNAMQSDLKGNGINYTPVHQGYNGNVDYTTKDYVSGNNDLKYALEQAAKNSGTGQASTENYVKSLYNRIGSRRGDGSVITLSDINKELNRLGLSDYNSSNALLTAGGTLLPGNEFIRSHTGADGSNSADSLWTTYGGQDYLMGGDSANFAQYVNGKTGNLDNLSFLFGNMQNNPYAQQDPEFLASYNQALNQFNQAAYGDGANGGDANGGYTGNQKVDNFIDYYNSLGNFYGSTGGNYGGTSNLLELLQGYLDKGLNANQDFINQQKTLAQQNAENMARSAWVNNQLQQDRMRDSLSAAGLGTSGALQSAELGLQGQYNNAMGDINSNLSSMLQNLNGQELQILSDYYNNLTNYAYDISNSEADRQMQQAQLALQQQQAAYDQWIGQQQLALQQQQWDWQKQQAEREYENTLSQQDYNKKLQQASNYWDAYNAGVLGDEGLYNALYGLGFVDNGYWPNGSYTQGATSAQLERLLAQAQLQNQYLDNQKLQSSLKKSKSGGRNNTQIDSFWDSEPKAEAKKDIAKLWYTGKPNTNLLTQTANYLIDKNKQ